VTEGGSCRPALALAGWFERPGRVKMLLRVDWAHWRALQSKAGRGVRCQSARASSVVSAPQLDLALFAAPVELHCCSLLVGSVPLGSTVPAGPPSSGSRSRPRPRCRRRQLAKPAHSDNGKVSCTAIPTARSPCGRRALSGSSGRISGRALAAATRTTFGARWIPRQTEPS